MSKLKIHTLNYTATFTGTIQVAAENKAKAKFIIEQGFGGLIATVGQSSWEVNQLFDEDEDGIVAYDMNTHPDKIKIT